MGCQMCGDGRHGARAMIIGCNGLAQRRRDAKGGREGAMASDRRGVVTGRFPIVRGGKVIFTTEGEEGAPACRLGGANRVIAQAPSPIPLFTMKSMKNMKGRNSNRACPSCSSWCIPAGRYQYLRHAACATGRPEPDLCVLASLREARLPGVRHLCAFLPATPMPPCSHSTPRPLRGFPPGGRPYRRSANEMRSPATASPLPSASVRWGVIASGRAAGR